MAQRQFRSDDTALWLDKFGNGVDGVKTVSSNTTYDGANAGCSGTAAATALTLDAASTFSNGDLILIHQSRGTGVGAWELNKIAAGAGTTALTLAYPLINTYTDSGASQAQVVELKEYSSLTVDSGITWSAPEWDGNKGGILGFLCNGMSTITGTISASSKGFVGGVQSSQGVTTGFAGEGSSGSSAQQTTANGNGGGGSAGTTANLHGGGGGGHSSSGSAGTNGNSGTTGSGGDSSGNAGLTTATFGGAGGAAGAKNEAGRTGGAGGDGGGFLFLASKTLTVTGAIVGAGASGSAGSAGDGAGGGGGAGGAVLIKGQTLTLGSSLIAAAGGAGAGPTGTGGSGASGRIHADYLTSFTGTTNPTLDSRQDASLTDQSRAAFFFSLM